MGRLFSNPEQALLRLVQKLSTLPKPPADLSASSEVDGPVSIAPTKKCRLDWLEPGKRCCACRGTPSESGFRRDIVDGVSHLAHASATETRQNGETKQTQISNRLLPLRKFCFSQFMQLTTVPGHLTAHMAQLTSFSSEGYHGAVGAAVAYFFALLALPARYRFWAPGERQRLATAERTRTRRQRELVALAGQPTPGQQAAARVADTADLRSPKRRLAAARLGPGMQAETALLAAALDAHEREWAALLDAQMADINEVAERRDPDLPPVPGRAELAAAVSWRVREGLGGAFVGFFDGLAADLERELAIDGQTEGVALDELLGPQLRAVAERGRRLSADELDEARAAQKQEAQEQEAQELEAQEQEAQDQEGQEQEAKRQRSSGGGKRATRAWWEEAFVGGNGKQQLEI